MGRRLRHAHLLLSRWTLHGSIHRVRERRLHVMRNGRATGSSWMLEPPVRMMGRGGRVMLWNATLLLLRTHHAVDSFQMPLRGMRSRTQFKTHGTSPSTRLLPKLSRLGFTCCWRSHRSDGSHLLQDCRGWMLLRMAEMWRTTLGTARLRRGTNR